MAAGIALLFIVIGFASSGLPGGLIMLGLVGLLVALVAAVRGRLPGIASRKVAGGVAGVAALLLVVGTATAPPTDTSTASSESQAEAEAEAAEAEARRAEQREREAEEAEEAAIRAAEESLAAADESPVPEGAGEPGQLSDADAGAAVGGAAPTTALAALAAIEVKGRAPRTGYDRDLFGSGWLDTDGNGCDTRNDILERDLTGETFKPGTRNCVVLTGTLADPYSGRTIAFQRGQDTSSDVQIDHVVALSDAWQKGAQQMSDGQRRQFANDPLNLLAVDGPLNMQKGDGDAATWLPPNRSYRCAYVARQVAVKATYPLWMTQAEKNAIATVLSACPNEPLPAGVVVAVPERETPPPPAPQDDAPVVVVPAPRPAPQAAPAPPPAPRPAPAPAPRPAPAPALPPPPSGGVYYQNCDAVRAAGAAPIRPGDPGWQQKFDRDKDGIGCDK
ncbi:GmrSD restriction endonuclease domain-containing protein [Blastococcus sp. SYSU DS0617]